MKSIRLIWIGLSLLSTINLFSQSVKLNTNLLEPVNVSVTVNKVNGKEEVKVIKSDSIKEFDEPTFAKIKGIDFRNGSIEVKVFSRLLSNAPESARGFIGVAFRIDDRNSKF